MYYTFSHLKRPFCRAKKIRKCKINRRAYPLGIVSLTPIVLLNPAFLLPQVKDDA
jgi:hypothetical protein